MPPESFVRLSEVRMEDVGKRHGDVWAVRDVSISVRPGEFYTVLGPPGAGKTSILRMLAGLIRPDAGRIFVDDQLVDPVPPEGRNIGLVFSGGALWPHMSVFENVAFGPRARGVAGGEVDAKVKAALALVGLPDAGARSPSDLSAGDRQRVALARALVVGPRLLLLDEPFALLEVAERGRTRADLARLHRDLGITTICATRDQTEALALSTRIAVIAGGRVVQEAKPDDIYWRPRTRFVAEWVGAANLVPVRVVELREMGVVVETSGGARLPVASGGRAWTISAPALLCLRPEALQIEEAALAPGGIPGTVTAHVFEGARQIYEVDIAGGRLRVETITSALLARSFKPGDHVKVEVSAESSVLLPDEGCPTHALMAR
jgi:ABC-type Fe3+/spermidine/putrescine transport system ATPase subunit